MSDTFGGNPVRKIMNLWKRAIRSSAAATVRMINLINDFYHLTAHYCLFSISNSSLSSTLLIPSLLLVDASRLFPSYDLRLCSSLDGGSSALPAVGTCTCEEAVIVCNHRYRQLCFVALLPFPPCPVPLYTCVYACMRPLVCDCASYSFWMGENTKCVVLMPTFYACLSVGSGFIGLNDHPTRCTVIGSTFLTWD